MDTAGDLLNLFPPGTRTDDDGTLVVSGRRLDAVAEQFGTPAIVVAEPALRARARDYLTAFRSRWSRSDVAFASKSFPCTAVQRVMTQEGLHLGGGLGVRNTYDEHPPDLAAYADAMVGQARALLPSGSRIIVEPGRSMVAATACTLYRVTTVKRGEVVHVAVD